MPEVDPELNLKALQWSLDILWSKHCEESKEINRLREELAEREKIRELLNEPIRGLRKALGQ